VPLGRKPSTARKFAAGVCARGALLNSYWAVFDLHDLDQVHLLAVGGDTLISGRRAGRDRRRLASAHLQKLVDATVLSVLAQGRFRYYWIRDDEVASLIENLVNLAVTVSSRGKSPARCG